jgi:flagellar hook-length control protein FliK
VDVPPPAAAPVPLADPAAVASARTASIAETVDQIASAVAARILVTPSLAAGGDGEIHITLQPAILDGSTVTLTATNGTLAVAVVPATAEAAALAAAALPQLAAAMEAHAPAFRRVQVSLASKKGNPDETV